MCFVKAILLLKRFFNIPDDAYLEGYWQDPSYFKDIRNLLLEEFSFKEPLPTYCTEIFNKILTFIHDCIIFIIRRRQRQNVVFEHAG